MHCCSNKPTPERYELSWNCDHPRAQILLVHGLGEHCGRWEHVAKFLNSRGYTVHAYDLRGHGRSAGPRVDIQDFDDYVRDLEEMVDKVHQAGLPLIIYAHSMGGLIATRYAQSSRPQPQAYVLSAPALAAKVPTWLRVAARAVGRLLPTLRMSSSIRGEQLSQDPAVGQAYFADPLVNIKGSARHGKLLLAAMDETAKALESFPVPCLVVHGEGDHLVPLSASDCLERCANVERKTYPGLRHEPHNEPQQELVLNDIATWLDARFPPVT